MSKRQRAADHHVTLHGMPTPKVSPRRRAATKGDRNESQILETAARLLADRPLSAISVEDLAGGAGLSRPTFYFYFGSRTAVLQALAESIAHDLYRASEHWLEETSEDPAQAARRGLESHLELWRRHGPVMRAIHQCRDSEPALWDYWTEVFRRLTDAVADQIERERAAGIAPPGPPSAKSLAGALMAMNDRMCDDASRRPLSKARDREIVDMLTAIWMRTIYAETPDPPRRAV